MTQIASRPIANLTAYWQPELPSMTVENLRNPHRDMVDSGPRSLVAAIEAEFAARKINPFSLEPARPRSR